jgi:hypothetical protein
MMYPKGTNIRDIQTFDRGIKVTFGCKEHTDIVYRSKDPFASNWFPANDVTERAEFTMTINSLCSHTLKDDVWFTTETYVSGSSGSFFKS